MPIINEAELKLAQIEDIIQQWLNKQGEDKCWWFPEVLQEIADVLELKTKVEPALPPLEKFREGCRRYQEEQYNHG